AWSSAVIRAPKRFELLGIEWDGGEDPGIQVRARAADSGWSDWLDAPLGHGHGPDDPLKTVPRLTDPVWTGAAQLFQLRASRPLAGARVVLVDSGTHAHASAKRYVDTGLAAGPGQPKIIARPSWATAACKPRSPAWLGAVDLVFVHHTVSSNYYRPSQSAALVRSICLFHKYGNRWNDIGYNFVVDRYGQIFEARAGGVDEPIVGAQAGGYNVYSTGVALLGSFGGRGPGRQAFNALSRLVAWKLSLHGVAVPGKVTVEVTRTGAPYSRYRAGSRVRLDHVSGHRDADTTACPGNGLYRQLPRLRQAVRNLAPRVSSLTARPAPAGPGAASVTGVLTADGVPIAGAGVELQQRTAHGMTTIALATTAPDGTWTTTGPVAANASLRALFRGDPAHSAVVSSPVEVTVPPQISLSAATPQTPPGGVVEFTGAVTPAKTKIAIVISQQQPDGTFAPVRTIRFKAARDGIFTRTIGFPAPGQYQVVAQTAADSRNAAGASAPVAITAA
ncbi:MAG: N-acetylmuramoyl-L-alanine amidase, partial [Thermoleophilaceae bacterium]